MKKFYALALAAAVVFGASARYQAITTDLPADVLKNAKTLNFRSIKGITPSSKPAKAPAAGATLQDYEGSYTFTCQNLLSQMPPEVIDIAITDAETGAVEIFFYSDMSVKATLDLAAGTLSIPNKQYIGQDSDGPIYFYVKGVTDEGQLTNGASEVEASVGTIDDMTITFPQFDVWAFGDPDQEKLGWCILTYNNAFTYGLADPNEGWEDCGEVTFQDGWVLPAFGIDQTDKANWYKVALQKHIEYDGLYRLVNPYQGASPVAEINQCTTDGYIMFDVSDPDHVMFGIVAAGFGYAELGLSNIYCYNGLAYLVYNYDMDPSDIITILGEDYTYSTFKDNVLTVPCPPSEQYGYLADACFGIPGDEIGGYNWQSQDGKSAFMEAKIFFNGSEENGVESVIIGEADGVKEYFNLQGVRVANPENGLFIVRQGGKTTKQVIR